MLHICRHLARVLLACAALSACDVKVKLGNFDEDKAQALAGMETYRTLSQQQDYTGLYALTSPALKTAVSKEQFISSAKDATVQLGIYKSSVLIGSSCFPNEVRLVYDTEFERGSVRELIRWSVSGSQAELAEYRVLARQDEFRKDLQKGCPEL